MRLREPLAGGALALLLVGGCTGGGEPPARTPPPDARRVDASRAGRLTGRVTIEGAVPRNSAIDMSSDSACARAHSEAPTAETFSSENGGLGNVFVYVKDGLGGYYFDIPTEPVVVDQTGCQYVPRVFGARAGQSIQFVNSDTTMHNVHAVGGLNPGFNFSQRIKGQKDVRTFPKPEVMVRLKCDVHIWMASYGGILAHPYFAVTKPSGNFEIGNLPAGSYTIEAWHEQLGTKTLSVTLGDNETKDITFAFAHATSTP